MVARSYCRPLQGLGPTRYFIYYHRMRSCPPVCPSTSSLSTPSRACVALYLSVCMAISQSQRYPPPSHLPFTRLSSLRLMGYSNIKRDMNVPQINNCRCYLEISADICEQIDVLHTRWEYLTITLRDYLQYDSIIG